MSLKLLFKDEWETYIHILKKLRLSNDEIFFFLAIKEVEKGSENNSFNWPPAKGLPIKEQVESLGFTIHRADYFYQKFLTGKVRWLSIKEPLEDFVEFFTIYLKEYWGIDKGQEWMKLIRQYIKIIEKEF